MKLKFNLNEIEDFDSNFYRNHLISFFDNNNISTAWRNNFFNKHYGYRRMFAYLVNQFMGKELIEIGTSSGGGTLSLAYNSKNNVITYDRKGAGAREVWDVATLDNVESYILSDDNTKTALGNILEKNDHVEKILKSDLIFFDVDPHSGEHEDEFFYFLIENNYKGLVLWDDTNGKLKMWMKNKLNEIRESYSNIRVYDLLRYSWDEGTTLMCFGEQEITLE